MKYLLILLVLLFLPHHVSAFMLNGGPNGVGTSSCSYPLPLNSDPVAAAYSFRKLNSGYNGKALNLVRASDNTNMDIGFAANNCDFDTATAATFCASTTCKIATWYDQSGNAANAISASARPVYTSSCFNGLPCGTYTAGSTSLLATFSVGVSANTTSMIASETSGSGTGYLSLAGSTTNGTAIGYGTSGAGCVAVAYVGGNVYKSQENCSFSTEYRLASTHNNSLTQIYVSGVAGSILLGGSKILSAQTAINIGGGNSGTTGTISENIIFAPDISTNDLATLGTNQSSYWSVP